MELESFPNISFENALSIKYLLEKSVTFAHFAKNINMYLEKAL